MQLLYQWDGGIVRVADAEDDFVFPIVLQAMAAEALVDLRVGAAQWLKDGNRGSEVRQLLMAHAAKSECAPQA